MRGQGEAVRQRRTLAAPKSLRARASAAGRRTTQPAVSRTKNAQQPSSSAPNGGGRDRQQVAAPTEPQRRTATPSNRRRSAQPTARRQVAELRCRGDLVRSRNTSTRPIAAATGNAANSITQAQACQRAEVERLEVAHRHDEDRNGEGPRCRPASPIRAAGSRSPIP